MIDVVLGRVVCQILILIFLDPVVVQVIRDLRVRIVRQKFRLVGELLVQVTEESPLFI